MKAGFSMAIAACMLFAASAACAQTQNGGVNGEAGDRSGQEKVFDGAHMKMDEVSYDFGNVYRHGDDLVKVFEFENDGSAPLVVLSVTTSCSCLKADFSRKPVSPGGRGSIRITYEARKMETGPFHRVIRISSNSEDGVNLITVQGNSVDEAGPAGGR